MWIDLHMHEKTYSKDSFLSLEEIVALGRARGLDAVCITDHDDIGLREKAECYAKQVGFPIFVGYEFYSLEGDIVAFGVPEVPKERIHAQTFLDYVKSCGGIAIAAHPFRNNRRGLEENLLQVRGLDALEALNGSTLPDAGNRAFAYAKRLGLQTVGASDCHVRAKVGICATYFPKPVETMAAFLDAFRTQRLAPAIYRNGRYEIMDRQEAPMGMLPEPERLQDKIEALGAPLPAAGA